MPFPSYPHVGDKVHSHRTRMGVGSMRRMGGGRRGGASIDKNGDEGTYIIPVGMPIDGLSGRNSDYSGITVGTILTLTINEDGVVCAASAE